MIARLLEMFMNWMYPTRFFTQCKVQKSSLGEYTCCIKREGHKGLHMNYEGNCF